MAAWADEPIQLREDFAPGYTYHVSARVEMEGTLTLPPEKGKPAPRPLAVTGSSVIEYDERVLTAAQGKVDKTARIYRRIDFRRKVGDRPQQNTIRPPVRRLVVLRHRNAEVPFSPDGPLMWNEIDLVRTDVFTPALVGLLPDRAVRVGDRWTAAAGAVQELTDLERIEDGTVECRLDDIVVLDRRRHARVSFSGTVRGINEDGPNRQRLDGYLFFDLDGRHLGYLSLNGVSSLLDKDGKDLGQVQGRFVLTRQVRPNAPDLAPEAWRGIVVEPNADNTLLLYDNPDVGVRFLYPRRWRAAGAGGRQVALDEANGSGLLVTLDPPDRARTGAAFQAEVRDWLDRQKGRVLRADPPRPLPGAPGVDRFGFEADLAGRRVVLEYAAVRQVNGGATIAARLTPADAAALRADLDRLCRSLAVTRRIPAEPGR